MVSSSQDTALPERRIAQYCPDAEITRAEAAVLVAHAFDLVALVECVAWSKAGTGGSGGLDGGVGASGTTSDASVGSGGMADASSGGTGGKDGTGGMGPGGATTGGRAATGGTHAGGSPADAQASPTDAARASGAPSAKSDAGCGCSLARGTPTRTALLAAALLVVCTRRRSGWPKQWGRLS